jgi:hypothetical protein
VVAIWFGFVATGADNTTKYVFIGWLIIAIIIVLIIEPVRWADIHRPTKRHPRLSMVHSSASSFRSQFHCSSPADEWHSAHRLDHRVRWRHLHHRIHAWLELCGLLNASMSLAWSLAYSVFACEITKVKALLGDR